MADLVPVTFPIPGESAVASYSYTDIIAGDGVIEFYGAVSAQLTGAANPPITVTKKYILTTSQVPSDEVYTRGTVTMNFDTNVFNSSRTVRGTAYLSAGVYMSVSGGLTSITVRLQKVSPLATTDISSTIYARIPSGNGGHKMILVPIELTQTTFNQGDYLRCEVIQVVSNGNVDFGHDPTAREGGQILSSVTDPTINSRMRLLVPVRIDL